MKKNIVKLKNSDIHSLVKKIIKEEGEERSSRYMFFSNLEQIHRQTAMLLDMDESVLEKILDGGHDWAQDHVAEAKNNMDQVFDFIMNKTKEPEDVHVDMMEEKWSKKYKESINCNNPKGFSQKAHCQGRKKRMDENRELLNQLLGSDNKNKVKESIFGSTTASQAGSLGRGGSDSLGGSSRRKPYKWNVPPSDHEIKKPTIHDVIVDLYGEDFGVLGLADDRLTQKQKQDAWAKHKEIHDNKKQNLDEGIKDWIVGGTLALATMLGGPAKAQAQKIYPDMEMSNLNKRDAKKVAKLVKDLDNEDKYFQIIDTLKTINPEDSIYLETDDDTKELIKTMDKIRTKYFERGPGEHYAVAKRTQYKGEMDSGEKLHDQRIQFPDLDDEGNYKLKKSPDIYTSKKGTAYTPNIYKNQKERDKYYDKVGKEVSTGNYKGL